VHRNAIDFSLDSIRPGLCEGHTVDLLQDVDAHWGLADLKDGIGVTTEIRRIDATQRSAKGGEGAIDKLGVGPLRADKNVEVFSGSWFGVDAHRVAANNKVVNRVCVERE